jgi:nucleoside diphosphate kinase
VEANFDRAIWLPLSSLIFVLIKPDAVASGKATEVLARLVRSDFIPLDMQVNFLPHEQQFEELYKFNLTLKNSQNQISSWWLNRKTYTAGPSITLLMHHRRLAGLALYEVFKELKGPSSPLRGRPGQIRYDLGACNKAMNLIHAADDPFSSLREFLCFRSIPRLIEVLSSLQPSSDGQQQHRLCMVMEGDLSRMLPLPQAECDFPTSLFRLRAQVLAAVANLEGRLPPLQRLRAAQWRDLPHTKDRLLQLATIFRRDAGLMSSILRSVEGPASRRLVEALQIFSDIDGWSEQSLNGAVNAILAAGLELPRWERLTLEASAHYIDDFTEVLANQRRAG